MVSFDEFKKIELRIGKILSVEDHPDADRLYVLRVDLGEEQRQLVAGLRPYYTADQLQDKYIVVVTNLEPAVLRGVESQGMLLAAGEGPKVVLLQPETEIAPGSKVL